MSSVDARALADVHAARRNRTSGWTLRMLKEVNDELRRNRVSEPQTVDLQGAAAR